MLWAAGEKQIAHIRLNELCWPQAKAVCLNCDDTIRTLSLQVSL